MSNFQEVNSFLQKPSSITRQSFLMKGLSTSSNRTSKLDLNRLLELLNITNDVNLQIKVLTVLSSYLMFNKCANIDVIIKSNAVYDKIYNILSRGLQRKSSEALNFLSTLLYIDVEEDGMTKKKSLAIFARNMTRVSGCLSAMCEMFTNYMLFHDTWKALCQCLAVACNDNETNQSYCSHLIPVCIQKCSQVNIDVLLVLQSLMVNHSKNSQLFLDYNGVKIFTRDLLHYDKCLQLLTTVVQYPEASTSLIQQTNVMADLRDFLRLYGPNSQLGQKAIIILNYISYSAKEKESRHATIASKNKIKSNESIQEKVLAKKPLPENDLNVNTEKDFEETKVLIQNVMKEIFNWKQNEFNNLKKAESRLVHDAMNLSKMPSIVSKQKLTCKRKQLNKTNTLTKKRTTDEMSTLMEKNRGNKLRRKTASELPFSFLQNNVFQVPMNKNTEKYSSRFHKNYTQLEIDDSLLKDTPFDESNTDTKKTYKEPTTLQDFSPIFASTPKQTTVSQNFTEVSVNTYKTTSTQTKQNKYNDLKLKRQKAKNIIQKKNSMKNRSLGARFFGAINESCTTFVKTVKNIFNIKKSSDSRSSNSIENTIVKDKQTREYSFMSYMRKRDAVINNNCLKKKSDSNESSTEPHSCKTCDDTEFLKHKLTKDEFLKQTVKKLKLGINLYGCDFKKISRTMWPRETYMTPLVLYNLYRKLILK